MFGSCFVMQYIVFFCNYIAEKENVGCITMVELLLPCGYHRIALCLFLLVRWDGLWSVIVAFLGQTHLSI